jgi:hypothetical protein
MGDVPAAAANREAISHGLGVWRATLLRMARV